MIEIDTSETINNLVQKYPEVKNIMVDIGFANITKPGLLQSVGKVMTIQMGAKMKGINRDKIVAAFREYGFILNRINDD